MSPIDQIASAVDVLLAIGSFGFAIFADTIGVRVAFLLAAALLASNAWAILT